MGLLKDLIAVIEDDVARKPFLSPRALETDQHDRCACGIVGDIAANAAQIANRAFGMHAANVLRQVANAPT